MEGWQLTLVIVAGMLLVGLLSVLFVLWLIKRTAMGFLDRTVNKAINKTAEVMGERVISPTVKAVGDTVQEAREEARRNDPRTLEVQITQMAEREKGELTRAQIVSELGIPQDRVQQVLTRMVNARTCRVEIEGDRTAYVFEAFLQRVEVWLCGYCDARYEAEPADGKCGSCGSAVARAKVAP